MTFALRQGISDNLKIPAILQVRYTGLTKVLAWNSIDCKEVSQETSFCVDVLVGPGTHRRGKSEKLRHLMRKRYDGGSIQFESLMALILCNKIP